MFLKVCSLEHMACSFSLPLLWVEPELFFHKLILRTNIQAQTPTYLSLFTKFIYSVIWNGCCFVCLSFHPPIILVQTGCVTTSLSPDSCAIHNVVHPTLYDESFVWGSNSLVVYIITDLFCMDLDLLVLVAVCVYKV